MTRRPAPHTPARRAPPLPAVSGVLRPRIGDPPCSPVPPHPQAGLTREWFADHTAIAISGGLDAVPTPSLRDRLHAALQDTGAYLIVDLSSVTFCDASGLAMLVGACRRTEPKGTAVVFAGPHPQAARLPEITGPLSTLTMRSSIAEARTARPDPRSAAA